MENIIDLQVQIILWIQSLGDWLTVPFQVITFLGEPDFYLLVAPALYWCVDARLGLRFGFSLMVSIAFNLFLKTLFHAPRPYWVSDQISAHNIATEYGMPSGHAQNSVVVYGVLTKSRVARWTWGAVAILSLLIGLSRLYLGVHFLGDVLVGWVVGILLLVAILRLEAPVVRWFRQQPEIAQYLLIFLGSLVAIIIGWIIKESSNWTVPQAWILNMSRYIELEEGFDPVSLSEFFSLGGTIVGLVGGAAWLHNSGGFKTAGNLSQILFRYFLGIIGLLLIYIGLDWIFPEGDNLIANLFQYLRYGLVGLWISALAPFIFRRLGLAE